MTSRLAAAAALVLALASGCAAQHEEASRNEAAPATEREYEAPAEEQLAPGPTGSADDVQQAPRSLAEIELELATNNAKLRELGVELPSTAMPAEALGDVRSGDATGTKTTTTGEAGRKTSPSTAPPPGAQPSPKPSNFDRESKPPKRDKGGGKAKDDAERGLAGGGERPDQAKAAPLSPADEGLDAAARCQQVCDLAAISCDLGDQICELADRHPDEPEYASACERANTDCEAAKEACDACVE